MKVPNSALLRTLTRPFLRLPGIDVLERASVYSAFRKPIQPYRLDTALIHHAATEKALTNACTYGHRGVHVYWSPISSGKSTSMRYIAPKLVREGKLAGAVLVEGGVRDDPIVDASEWLCGELGMWHMDNNFSSHLADMLETRSRETLMKKTARFIENREGGSFFPLDSLGSRWRALGHPEENLKPKPYIIMIDQFDEIMRTADPRTLQNLIVTLAGVGHRTKLFTVILAVASIENAKTVLSWNGCQKIDLISPKPGLFKWEKHEIVRLADELAKENSNGKKTRISDRLIELCWEAGTPGVVIDAHRGEVYEEALGEKVKKIQASWDRVSELHGSSTIVK